MYISNEKENYLRKIKLEKFMVLLVRILILVLFLLIWEVLSRLNIINTFLFSSPSNILKTLLKLVKDGNFFNHLFVTLFEIFISFILSSLFGFLVATILWSNRFISKVVSPYLTVINSLPKVALGPLIIIWVGSSKNSIIFMALLISTFITIINIYNSFDNTNNNYLTLMKSFKSNKWQIFKYVVLPSNILNIISALKINISMILIGVIMGELLVSKSGIGYLIMYGSQVFNIDLVITGVFILGIISYIMYYFISKLESCIRYK